MWNSILEPEDNADDVENFQDIPDSPTHDSALESATVQEVEAAAAAPSRAVQKEEEDDDDNEDEGSEEGDMGPSTSGQEAGPSARGQNGAAPGAALQNAQVGYDMRKRCVLSLVPPGHISWEGLGYLPMSD